jgi:hypothetical protein
VQTYDIFLDFAIAKVHNFYLYFETHFTFLISGSLLFQVTALYGQVGVRILIFHALGVGPFARKYDHVSI